MPASKYKVMATGSPMGDGATASVHVVMAGVAKKITAAYPFIVANEVMCSAIARLLLLPCPPGAVMEFNNETYFVSLDFNLAGQTLPPVSAASLVAERPRDCWGIIVFDIFILNDDRHNKNIAFDTTTKGLQIFDHSHALLGPTGDFAARLAANRDLLGIGGHCLALEMNTDDGLTLWTARIKEISDYFLEGLVESACSVGVPIGQKKLVSDFLKDRRDRIDAIITAQIGSFLKLPKVTP